MDAVDAHQVKPGMNELQTRLSLGQKIQTDNPQTEGNRTVTYDADGKKWTVTFAHDRATKVQGGWGLAGGSVKATGPGWSAPSRGTRYPYYPVSFCKLSSFSGLQRVYTPKYFYGLDFATDYSGKGLTGLSAPNPVGLSRRFTVYSLSRTFTH